MLSPAEILLPRLVAKFGLFREKGEMFLSYWDPSSHLESITKLLKWRVPTKYFTTLQLELQFLRTFLERCIEFHNFLTEKEKEEYHDVKDLLMRAKAVYERARFDIQELFEMGTSKRPDEEMLANKFNYIAAYVLDEVKLMRSEIREVHRIMWRTSPSHNRISDKDVKGSIYTLLKNLEDLISFKVDLVDPLKIKLQALEKKLRFLSTFLEFTTDWKENYEKLNDLLNHAKLVADNAAYLSYSCLVDEMDEDMLHTLVSDLSDLVQRIGPVTPEVRQIYIRALKVSLYTVHTSAVNFLESLLENIKELLSASWTVPMRDDIEVLQVELEFLRSFLMDPPGPPYQYGDYEIRFGLLAQSNVISSEAGVVVYSLYNGESNEETAAEVYFSLIFFLEGTKLFKAEIIEIYYEVLKLPYPKFPSTDELGFLDCFLQNLRELRNDRTDSITSLNLPVEPLVEELQFLRSFLSRIAKQPTEVEKLKVFWTQVIDVAYKTEYIIDSLLVRNGPTWHHMLWLSEVRKEIEVLTAEVNKIGEMKMHGSEVHCDAEISGQVPSQATSSEMDEVVVGFEDEKESIIDYLVRGSTKLQTISIVGMPGLGKTHLAKQIYNNPIVKDYFDVRVWCYVSQVYDRKYLLTCILNQVIEPTRSMLLMTDEELAGILRKSLKGKRYLVLMDDLWDVEPWNALQRSFPNDNNGSRIMFTSRFHNLNLGASGSKIHHLRPFSDDESWQLLQKKIFQSECCPSELLEVGKQIAKNCNGLPLAVVVVAGILSRIDKKRHHWREVANSQSSYIVDDPEKQSVKVIELSYKHLPDYLKPCFLYIGAFVKNKYIPVRKLIHLWIAEGFVHKVEQRSLENMAEDYLIDLIGRSLIIVTERRSTCDIKECDVHDLVRDFCLEKAKEDNFFQLIKLSPTSDLSIYEQRRIGCNQPDRFLLSRTYGPSVRSLLFFGPSNSLLSTSYKVSFILRRFKILKVLDLACIFIDDTFPDDVSLLGHLRYLAICGNFDSIPSSIAELWYLETFIVTAYSVDLPHTIWNMVNLRHLHISDSASVGRPFCSGFSRLENLQTISTILLPCGDDIAELVKGLANVKHLKCILSDSWDCSDNCKRSPELETLCQLDSLKVSYHGKRLHTYEFSLPPNLKKLTMSGFRMPWNTISIIGKLPNLEVLKLLDEAFHGEEWDMTEGEFPKLKFLKLNNLDIRKWSISSDNLPPLEQLVLRSCPQLEDIPTCLGDIPTLKRIEVRRCSSSLKELVKQIQDEQMDMGNEELEVFVK